MASPLGRFTSYTAFGSLLGQGPSVAMSSRALKRCLWTAHLFQSGVHHSTVSEACSSTFAGLPRRRA